MEELDPHGILMGYTVIRTLVGGDWNMTFIFPYIGNVIIPIDFDIFQRGGSTTNQTSPGGWIQSATLIGKVRKNN